MNDLLESELTTEEIDAIDAMMDHICEHWPDPQPKLSQDKFRRLVLGVPYKKEG